MKISLDTEDVKKAIREFVQNRWIIQPDTNITMEIVPLRQGEEKLRVDIVIEDELDNAMPLVGMTSVRETVPEVSEQASDSEGKQSGIFDNLK